MIAYGMLYTAAVGVPIALAAIAIAAVLRRYGKAERLVWAVALVTALLLPVVALLDPFSGSQAVPPELGTGVIGLPAVMVVPADDPALGPGQLLIASWLLLSAVLALRWAVAGLRLARAARSWTFATLDGVPVWLTESMGPAVAGTLRPRLLVPSWLRSLPAAQRSLVLLHEQEHIRARDPLLIALTRLARVLVPWNPVVWLLSARLIRAVELDCDRRVLRQSNDVATYGRTLLTVSERRPGRMVAVAAFAESEAPLRSRILAMTSPPRTVSIVALLTSMVLGVVLLVGALEIPVPTVSFQVAVEPGAAPEPPPSASAGDPRLPGRPAVERQDRDGRQGADASGAPSTSAGEELVRVPTAELERQRRASEAERETPRPSDDDIAARPTFTPYTVAPAILNRQQVSDALVAEYPALLRDAGVGGSAHVYFFIDENGEVRDARIARSSGHPALDDAALAVASVFRFSPALNRDRRVAVWVMFPITFRVVQ